MRLRRIIGLMGGQARQAAKGAMERAVIRGAQDMTSCGELKRLQARSRGLIRDGAKGLVIDLTCVDEADTKLLACLVAVYQHARRSSVRVELFASRKVVEVAEICRLKWFIDQTAPLR